MTNKSSLAAAAAGVFALFFGSLMLDLVPGAAAAVPAPEPMVDPADVPEAEPAAAPAAVPALARDITIQGCLEFSDILFPGAFVVWCRPCDQVCIIILQEGVDDRAVIRVPDAPLDSPMRHFSAGSYSVHRSRGGVGIRVADAKPISE